MLFGFVYFKKTIDILLVGIQSLCLVFINMKINKI